VTSYFAIGTVIGNPFST